jgi:hypothetical protein
MDKNTVLIPGRKISMLRITIEVLPRGDESKKRHLGTVEIANDGTGDEQYGNYAVRLAKFGRPTQTWLRGVVQRFDRVRKGPYDLLLQCLIATVGNRNPTVLSKLKNEFDQRSCFTEDL